MIVGTLNLLKAAVLRAVPLAGSGYSSANLANDSIAKGWRTLSDEAIVEIEYRHDGAPTANFAAVFGAYAYTGSTRVGLSQATLEASPDGSAWSPIATIDLDTRGDGFATFAGNAGPYWRWTFTPDGAATVKIGELYLAEAITLSRQFMDRRDARDFGTLINTAVSGHSYRIQQRDRLDRLDLDWDRLLEAEFAELLAIVEAVRGALYPVVIVPNEEDTQVLHGTIQDAFDWQTDDPTVVGVGLQFEESGRPLSVVI